MTNQWFLWMRIFAYFILKEKMGKLPLELFSQVLITSSKNSLTSPSRGITPENVQTQKCADFFKSTPGGLMLL